MSRFGLTGALAMLGGLALCQAAGAESLNDALVLAYQSNPTLQGERAQLRALNEGYVQAMSGFRLQASASAEFDYTKNPSTLESEYDAASASVSLSQPIYTGGLVTAQVRAAMADILSGRQKLRQTEAQVFQSVIQAYVDVRRDQQGLKIAQDNVDVLRRQLDETQARLEVGELTRTDEAQAQARLAQAHAQLATAEAQLEVSRSNYVEVVGQSPGDLAPETPLPELPASLDLAFAGADRNSPAILAADFAERATAARVAVAKAANRPTLSVRATLGDSGVPAVSEPYAAYQTQIPGMYSQNITASAVFTQPLFTGGLNSSRIREALENDNTQRIAVEQARRQTTQAVAQAWYQLTASRANAEADERQVSADQVAFDGARQEAQGGLRTTIDVLNAEQELHQAELALVVARHDEYVAGAAVLAAMGQLEGATLLKGQAPIYDPAAPFNKVRASGASMPWDGVVKAIDGLGAPRDPATPVVPAHAGGQVLP